MTSSFPKCPICHKNMAVLRYMDIESGYNYSHKGFRCDSCQSFYPHTTRNSLKPASSKRLDDSGVQLMNVWAAKEYADFRFPRACPFCETALLGVLASSEENPGVAIFEGLECPSCKSYFDKTVLNKLKDYVNEDDEWGWRRLTPEEVEKDRLEWEAGALKCERS